MNYNNNHQRDFRSKEDKERWIRDQSLKYGENWLRENSPDFANDVMSWVRDCIEIDSKGSVRKKEGTRSALDDNDDDDDRSNSKKRMIRIYNQELQCMSVVPLEHILDHIDFDSEG